MIIALFVLAFLNCAQTGVILALLNRVLMQAKLPVIDMPKWRNDEENETPKEKERRKLFSVDIPS